MNIAILIPTLACGGAERVAQTIGNYYVGKGYQVYYFLADMDLKQDYPVKGTIVKTNIRSCVTGKSISDMQRKIKLWYSSLKIRKLKHHYKIDVAISFMEEFNYINVLSKGKEKVITRVCTTLSEYEKMNPSNFLLKKGVVRFFYARSDRVVVLSRRGFKEMQFLYGIPKKKILCIPNMVVDKKGIKKETDDWKYGTKTVVCVGRLEAVKQYERIIRAFSYVCYREADAKLIILGKGSQLRYLKNICKKLHIEDNVVFEGFSDNVPYYLQHARVFVMASRMEGFPNSMIEAMNYGVPIVTCDSPGACGEIVGNLRELKNDDSIVFCKYGIIVPYIPYEKFKVDTQLSRKEMILGEAMLKVLTDDGIYERYNKQSLKRAKMFSMERVIKKWDSIVEN